VIKRTSGCLCFPSLLNLRMHLRGAKRRYQMWLQGQTQCVTGARPCGKVLQRKQDGEHASRRDREIHQLDSARSNSGEQQPYNPVRAGGPGGSGGGEGLERKRSVCWVDGDGLEVYEASGGGGDGDGLGRSVAANAAAGKRREATSAHVAAVSAEIRGGLDGGGGGGSGGGAGVGAGGEMCGTLRRHGDSWTTFSKVERHLAAALLDQGVMRCAHLIGNDHRRALILLSKRENGSGGGKLEKSVYCAECWERLEVKRAAAVVR